MNSSQSAETNSTSSHTQSVKEKEDDKIPFCRICHESEEKHSQLISPCGCKGSMKHVHRACIQKWINMTQQSMAPRCDICKKRFATVKQPPPWNTYPLRTQLYSFQRYWMRQFNHLWENHCTHDFCETVRYTVFVFLCLIAMIQGRLMYWFFLSPKGEPFVVQGVDDYVLMVFTIGLNVWLFRLIVLLIQKEYRQFLYTVGWGISIIGCGILSGIIVRLELLLLFNIPWKTFGLQLAHGSNIGWHFVLGFLGTIPHHLISVSLIWWIKDISHWRTRNTRYVIVNTQQ